MCKFNYWIFFVISPALYALTTVHVTLDTDSDPSGMGIGSGIAGDLRYCLNIMNIGLNAIPDDYAIIFDFANPTTITLNGILPLVNNSQNPVSITIGNPSGPTITIDGNSAYSGFFTPTGTVTIQNIVFQNMMARGGNGGDGISGGGGGMGAGGAIYVPQFFLNNSSTPPSITLMNVAINNCAAVGGNGGNYLGVSASGAEGGGGGGGFVGNGGSITTTGSTGGAGGGGNSGGNLAGGGGGGGSLTLSGGGGGGSAGNPGLQPQGSMAPGGSVVPSGGNGGDGGGGGGGGVVITVSTNSVDGQAGNGGYAGGGGGGAGTGATDVGYTVQGGSGGVGGGGGGGGVDQSGLTPATGGNSGGGGGGAGGGPSNSGSPAAGGTDTGSLGGGAGGAGANGAGPGFGGGGGGGGSGIGAAIFVDSNVNFTLQAIPGVPTTFNTVGNTPQAGAAGTGGAGGSDGNNGSALGNSIFLRSGATLTLIANDTADLLTLGTGVTFTDDASFGTGGTTIRVKGNGTVVYNGTSDYPGTIIINNANFKVNGQIDEAPVSVCRNISFSTQRGTLSGTGTLTGDVFVNSGTISPDTGGTLALGSLTLSAADPMNGTPGSLVHIEINGSGTSLVAVTGDVTLAGTLQIQLDPTAQPGTYVILTSAHISGTFDTVTFTGATPNYTLSYLPIGSPTFVQLDFLGYQPPSPTIVEPGDFHGAQKKNNFGFVYELYNQLTWTPSPSPAVTGYYIYRDGVRIAQVGAGTHAYRDHNQLPAVVSVYSLVAFDGNGNVSAPVTIAVP